jgi:hypothetical protein
MLVEPVFFCCCLQSLSLTTFYFQPSCAIESKIGLLYVT